MYPQKNIWEELKFKLDQAFYKPERAEEIESSIHQTKKGDYYTLANPSNFTFLRLEPEEFYLFEMMDGTHTTRDLIIEYFRKFNTLALGKINNLVNQLKENGFLIDKPVNFFSILKENLEKKKWWGKVKYFVTNLNKKEIVLKRVDSILDWLYRQFFFIFYTKPAQVIYPIIIAVGFYFFIKAFISGRFSLFTFGNSFLLGFIVLTVLDYFCIFIHEIFHGLTCKHYGRKASKTGFMFYLGMPAFFVDTSDIWMVERRKRIMVSLAGPLSGVILASFSAILAGLFPAWIISPILFRLAFLWYLDLLFNMDPFLELDGYYILIDILEIPMLRSKSFDFLKKGMWQKIRGRIKFERQEKIFLVFGLLSALWTLLTIMFSYLFWQSYFKNIITRWSESLSSIILLPLIIVLFVLPLLIGLGKKLVEITRWIGKKVLFIQSKMTERGIKKNLSLLTEIDFLKDVDDEDLLEVARNLKFEFYTQGKTIIREGDIGEKFYIIQAGSVEVFASQNTEEKILKQLGKGDYFGEIALLKKIPRTASIRALAPTELITIDRGTFERVLSGKVKAQARVKRSIDNVEYLEKFTILKELTEKEISLLVKCLKRKDCQAGQSIVKQGEIGDKFYLIDEGQVEVIKSIDGTEEREAILASGDYFGEIALVKDIPRTASARALTWVRVLTLGKDDFTLLLNNVFS